MKYADVLTVGEAARLFQVANRTVSKWIDAGLLPAYRLPLCGHRRVRRKDAEAFARARGLPFGEEEARP